MTVDLHEIHAAEAMSKTVHWAAPHENLRAAGQRMANHGIRALLVAGHSPSDLPGVVTSKDIVNVLGMVKVCRFPLLVIVTMRGETGEFNPWQVPMGEATARVLETMGVAVRQAGEAQTVAPHVRAALRIAFQAQGAEAVLVAQKVIGIKSFQEQANQ